MAALALRQEAGRTVPAHRQNRDFNNGDNARSPRSAPARWVACAVLCIAGAARFRAGASAGAGRRRAGAAGRVRARAYRSSQANGGASGVGPGRAQREVG